MIADQERREEARMEVRTWLHARSAVSSTAKAIRRGVNNEGFSFKPEEIDEALVFLVSAKQVEITPNDDGATLYYQITAAGTLAHERRKN